MSEPRLQQTEEAVAHLTRSIEDFPGVGKTTLVDRLIDRKSLPLRRALSPNADTVTYRDRPESSLAGTTAWTGPPGRHQPWCGDAR